MAVQLSCSEKTESKWQSFAGPLSGWFLLKLAVLSVCSVLVATQVSECIDKLRHTPITTYTHFKFNKTIQYPSLTFCREPPYKYFNLLRHGLYAHPRFTSMWRYFDFNKTSLEDLWNDITYNESEIFLAYGLDGHTENVEVTSTLGFVMGRCFTLAPKRPLRRATRASGYSVTLQHSALDASTNTGQFPAGYHVYVHYTQEPYTEVEVYNGGLVDYLHVKTGETIDVKLTVDEYSMISSADDECWPGGGEYSTNACTTRYVWDLVGEVAKCSGPWLQSALPACRDHAEMTTLISTYIALYQQHESCACPRLCHSLLYNGFVTDRHSYTWAANAHAPTPKTDADGLQIQLLVYFNGMMVSMYEERYNYDWSVFVADFGGSVGFLLGISVISLMGYVSKVWDLLFSSLPPGKKSSTHASDLPVTTKEAEKFKEWNSCHVGNFM